MINTAKLHMLMFGRPVQLSLRMLSALLSYLPMKSHTPDIIFKKESETSVAWLSLDRFSSTETHLKFKNTSKIQIKSNCFHKD